MKLEEYYGVGNNNFWVFRAFMRRASCKRCAGGGEEGRA